MFTNAVYIVNHHHVRAAHANAMVRGRGAHDATPEESPCNSGECAQLLYTIYVNHRDMFKVVVGIDEGLEIFHFQTPHYTPRSVAKLNFLHCHQTHLQQTKQKKAWKVISLTLLPNLANLGFKPGKWVGGIARGQYMISLTSPCCRISSPAPHGHVSGRLVEDRLAAREIYTHILYIYKCIYIYIHRGERKSERECETELQRER